MTEIIPEDIRAKAREISELIRDVILMERERCAEIADSFADEKDVMALGSCTDNQVAAYREGERTANQIAAAIRNPREQALQELSDIGQEMEERL